MLEHKQDSFRLDYLIMIKLERFLINLKRSNFSNLKLIDFSKLLFIF